VDFSRRRRRRRENAETARDRDKDTRPTNWLVKKQANDGIHCGIRNDVEQLRKWNLHELHLQRYIQAAEVCVGAAASLRVRRATKVLQQQCCESFRFAVPI
jgi:hypothetical protein